MVIRMSSIDPRTIVGRLEGYSECHRCGNTWNWKEGHTTYFEDERTLEQHDAEDQASVARERVSERRGMFPMCEECYQVSSPEERFKYHKELLDQWMENDALTAHSQRNGMSVQYYNQALARIAREVGYNYSANEHERTFEQMSARSNANASEKVSEQETLPKEIREYLIKTKQKEKKQIDLEDVKCSVIKKVKRFFLPIWASFFVLWGFYCLSITENNIAVTIQVVCIAVQVIVIIIWFAFGAWKK